MDDRIWFTKEVDVIGTSKSNSESAYEDAQTQWNMILSQFEADIAKNDGEITEIDYRSLESCTLVSGTYKQPTSYIITGYIRNIDSILAWRDSAAESHSSHNDNESSLDGRLVLDVTTTLTGMARRLYSDPHWYIEHGYDCKITGGNLEVDFTTEPKKMPYQVETISESYDNSQGPSPQELVMEISEEVVETQEIKLTRNVTSTNDFKIGVDYKGLSASANYTKNISVTKSSTSTVVRTRKVRKTHTTSVPAGKWLELQADIVKGTSVFPATGYIEADGMVLLKHKSRGWMTRRIDISSFLKPQQRRIRINGDCSIGEYKELKFRVIDHTPE